MKKFSREYRIYRAKSLIVVYGVWIAFAIMMMATELKMGILLLVMGVTSMIVNMVLSSGLVE